MATEIITSSLRKSSLDTDSSACLSMSAARPQESVCEDEAPDGWRKKETDQRSMMNNQQKKAHRRKPSKKKRKWKPYSKLSWEERKALDEKEKSKAVRMREEMKEKGRPVAPYNTTQFLMDEHDPYDGGFEPAGFTNPNAMATGTDEGESYSDDQDEQTDRSTANDDGSGIEEPMTGYTDSPHMVPEFISQDFSETYERVHEENLNKMSREELLKELVDLEERFSQLQEQLSKSKQKSSALEGKVQSLEIEKEQMRREIGRLSAECQSFIRRSDSGISASNEALSDVKENGSDPVTGADWERG